MTDAEREQLEAEFSDYHDGSMSPERRAAFERRLASEPGLKLEYEKFEEALRALSGLHRMAAGKLADEVASTINRRSGGRFFGRRSFGDRLPWEAIAVLGLVISAVVYVLIKVSDTGAVHAPLERPKAGSAADAGPRDVVPRPTP
jgi:anti-sigma factor RsiW